MREETNVATRSGLAKQDGGSEVEADTICYSAAMSACEKRQEWQLALVLLSRMAKEKVVTDTICYSAAISACEKTKVATRIGLAQQDGRSKSEANTIEER